MTTDDVLARLGLQTQTTAIDLILPALGIFGAGLLVGAGVALALSPKSGPELRSDIGRTAASLRDRFRPSHVRPSHGIADVDAMTRDELYAHARALEIEGRSEMTKAELAAAVGAQRT